MDHDDEDALESSSGLGSFRENPSGLMSLAESNDTNDKWFYGDADARFKLKIIPFEVPLLGVARPIVILLTILTNAFVVGFFLKMNDRKKSTNLLFASIAFSDTLTAVCLLPNSFYVYAGETMYLTRNWCLTFMVSKFFVSRAFHTVSVWQTVLLAIQRHLCVCYPFTSGKVCTYRKTFVAILVMYVLAFSLHEYMVFEEYASHGECAWRMEQPCHGTCIYLWVSVILQSLLPNLILVLLTIGTLVSLTMASRKALNMIATQSGTHARSSRDRIITITAILIAIIFLIPELPYGIYIIILIIYLPRDALVSLEQNHVVIAVYEVILILTFHVNFWIYCCTMSDFRRAILDLLICGRKRIRSRSGSKISRSSSSRNGSAKTTASRTSSATSRKRVLSKTTSVMSTSSDLFTQSAASPSKTRQRSENSRECVSRDMSLGINTSPSRLVRNRRYETMDDCEEASVNIQSTSSVQYLPHAKSFTHDIEVESKDELQEERDDDKTQSSTTDAIIEYTIEIKKEKPNSVDMDCGECNELKIVDKEERPNAVVTEAQTKSMTKDGGTESD